MFLFFVPNADTIKGAAVKTLVQVAGITDADEAAVLCEEGVNGRHRLPPQPLEGYPLTQARGASDDTTSHIAYIAF